MALSEVEGRQIFDVSLYLFAPPTALVRRAGFLLARIEGRQVVDVSLCLLVCRRALARRAGFLMAEVEGRQVVDVSLYLLVCGKAPARSAEVFPCCVQAGVCGGWSPCVFLFMLYVN